MPLGGGGGVGVGEGLKKILKSSGATIRIRLEMLCLLYAGFFLVKRFFFLEFFLVHYCNYCHHCHYYHIAR